MGLFDSVFDKVFGGESRSERDINDLAKSFYEQKPLQRYLPPELRQDKIGPFMSAGVQGLGSLLQNPGGLSPNVSEAILPRLSAESQSIAQNFRGIQSNQSGAAARGNLPTSIKAALQQALDVAQERAQRGARGQALTDSESLRREDLSNVYKLLDTILQFMSSGRGQAIPGLGMTAQMTNQRRASNMQFISDIIGSFGLGGAK